jgi:hypothetical protein
LNCTGRVTFFSFDIGPGSEEISPGNSDGGAVTSQVANAQAKGGEHLDETAMVNGTEGIELVDVRREFTVFDVGQACER